MGVLSTKALRAAVRPVDSGAERVVLKLLLTAASNFLVLHPATRCASLWRRHRPRHPRRRAGPGDIVSFDCGAFIERGGKRWHWRRRRRSASSSASSSFGDADFMTGTRATGTIAGIDEDLLGSVASSTPLRAVTVGRPGGLHQRRRQGGCRRTPSSAAGKPASSKFVGHGIGTRILPPDVLLLASAVSRLASSPAWCAAVEPMLTRGALASQTDDDEWAVRAVDGRDTQPTGSTRLRSRRTM